MDRDTRKQARKAVAATMHFVSSKIAKDGSPYWRMKGGDTPDGAADAASGVWEARIEELEAALKSIASEENCQMCQATISVCSRHMPAWRVARAALYGDKEAPHGEEL